MSARAILLPAALLGLLLLPGCPSPGPDVISPADRLRVLEAVRVQLAALPHQDLDADDQAIAAFMRTLPEYAEVEVRPHHVVRARFRDGRVHKVMNNRQVDPAWVPREARALPKSPPGLLAAAVDLPQGKTAALARAMGTAFPDAAGDIFNILGHRGYTPVRVVPDIEWFKSMGSYDVVYLDTHGDEESFMTAEQVSPEKEERYKDELDDLGGDGALVHYYSAIIDRLPDRKTTENRYGISSKFLIKYGVEFRPNSFLFADACDSAADSSDPKVLPMITALKGAMLSGYAGWDRDATAPATAVAASYAFDRLAGGNIYAAESPLQRPFDMAAVLKYMRDNGLDQAGAAHLQMTTLGSAFGILAPSIKYMDVDEESHKLILHGTFGSDPGGGKRSVKVGGNELQGCDWQQEQIQCDLPAADGYSGDVVATANGRPSNVVRLTEWRITMKYTQTVQTVAGTLRSEADFDLRVRADVHRFREQIGQDPAGRDGIVFRASDQSKMTYSHSGPMLTGSAALPYNKSGNPAVPGFLFEGTIEAGRPRPQLTAVLWFYGATGTLTINGASAPYPFYPSGKLLSKPSGPTYSTVAMPLAADLSVQPLDDDDSAGSKGEIKLHMHRDAAAPERGSEPPADGAEDQ